MENNIRTMEFVGTDDWGIPIYKCIETNILYKDMSLNRENPDLYTCQNDFDGEPCCPINKDLEIHYKTKMEQISEEKKFNYQMLDRLRQDCNYYLTNGNKNVKYLWAENEKEHVEEMKKIYNNFTDEDKPNWLTWEQILEYEKSMINK